jgi:DNA-binding NarL/FixJ family response regulator
VKKRPAAVLVVEDDHLVAMMTELILLDAGFDVAGIAVTSEEAMALARARKPDLIIMDITLSGERDGVDTAIELFRENGIRCIFATAHHDGATRRRAQAARPFGWLAKPYQPDALVYAVQSAMSEMGES